MILNMILNTKQLKLTICVFLVSNSVLAQIKPTVASLTTVTQKNEVTVFKPKTVTIMSALLPGLGQLCNKKYWKAPIVFGGLAGIGYWAILSHNQYSYYSNNLTALYDNDATTINNSGLTSTQLITQKNYYAKDRDLAILLGSVFYILNIIDANVDAHFLMYEKSNENIVLRIEPTSLININSQANLGFKLSLHF